MHGHPPHPRMPLPRSHPWAQLSVRGGGAADLLPQVTQLLPLQDSELASIQLSKLWRHFPGAEGGGEDWRRARAWVLGARSWSNTRGAADVAGMGAWPLPHSPGPRSAAPKACWRRLLTSASAIAQSHPRPTHPRPAPRACSASPPWPELALQPPSTPGSPPRQHPHSQPTGTCPRAAGTRGSEGDRRSACLLRLRKTAAHSGPSAHHHEPAGAGGEQAPRSPPRRADSPCLPAVPPASPCASPVVGWGRRPPWGSPGRVGKGPATCWSSGPWRGASPPAAGPAPPGALSAREAVGTASGAAQPAPDPATWPCLRLPSSCRPSLRPSLRRRRRRLRPRRLSISPRPSARPGPAPRSPSAGSARTMAGGGRRAGVRPSWPRAERAGLRPARVKAAHAAGAGVGVRNSPEGRGPGVAVCQGMPSANGGVTRLSVAGTAPPFRSKPLFLAGLPIPVWATGSPRSRGPGFNCSLPCVSPGPLEPNGVPSPPLTLGWPAGGLRLEVGGCPKGVPAEHTKYRGPGVRLSWLLVSQALPEGRDGGWVRSVYFGREKKMDEEMS